MRLSILWKLLIPIVLMVSVLSSALLWVQLHLLDESFRRRASGQIAIGTEVIKAEQHDLEEQALLVAQQLARDELLTQAVVKHHQKAMAAALASHVSPNGTPALAIFDSGANLIAATWSAQAQRVPPQIANLVPRALSGVSVAGPVPSWRLPGQVSIVAAGPVGRRLPVGGAVVVEIVIGNAFVDKVKHLTGLDAGVFLGDLRVVSTNFSKDGQRLVNQHAPSRKSRQTLAQGVVTNDLVAAGGRVFIARYLPLRSPAGPIIGMVGVGAPLDQIALDRRDTIRSSILASVLGLALACLVTVIIGYRILSPLRRLKDSAEAIRRGTPEHADFAIATHDEIQDLSTAMAEMVRNLADANTALREASQHKSEFLARMSHELRTPLNAVIGFSELLLERAVGDLTSEQDEYLRDIHSSGNHLLTLINEILDLSKIEAGRMELHLEETGLSDIIDDAVVTLRPLIERKRLNVSAALDPAVPLLRADKVRLKQIMFNLLSNAAKFTPDGGRIRVESRRVNGDVELSVLDSGPGIAEEDQPRLFREFTQLELTSPNEHIGTGLGLALVKRLADLHGGRVWVESQVGKGSRFVVRLPVGTRAIPAEHEGSILIVEDDAALRKLFVRYLAEAGYRTEETGDGQGVVAKVKATKPSVICLDIRLPGVEDWEVLRRLKDDPATASIPVVVTTVVDDAKTAFTLGAVDFLTKPIDRQSLLDAVGKAIPPHQIGTAAVLVVDDDPQVRERTGYVLREAGYDVLTASDGKKGIELAQRTAPGLVILDLLMPNVSGFEVVAALRADARTRSTPILILTAKDLTAAEWAYLNGRVQGIRIKGAAAPTALVDEVRRVLASREAAQK
jgi:signal transduction histidine kinase/CheY-like chemotaxis protein